MEYYGLNPTDMHDCGHCQYRYIEKKMNKGIEHRCVVRDGVLQKIYEINDCECWKSPFENDYRRRIDLEKTNEKK